MPARLRPLLPDLALVGATFVWGSTFVVVQDALADASPGAFLAVRFVLAAAAFVPVLAARRELGALRSPALLRAGALLGVAMAGAFLLQTWGLRFTTPSRGAFVTSLYVLMVPAALVLIERRSPGRWPMRGALLAAAGLFLLYRPGMAPPNRGDLLTLGCSATFAVQILLVDLYAPRFGAVPLTAVQTGAGAVLLLLAAPLEPMRFESTPRLWAALAITSVLATTAAFTLQVWSQKRLPVVRATVLFALEPVFAMAISGVLRRERVGWIEVAGGALVVAGILVSEIGRTTRE